MTNAEKQEIIEAVLAALATNSKTIAQLSPKQSLIDSDLFEVAGGSRVTYQVLRSLIREGLALESRLSDYVTGEQAMMYLAKLDTETGTVDYKESPLVMLDGFNGVNGYTPVTGDLYYENYHGFQIWIKRAGGDNKQGIVANPNVAYVNKNDGAIYRWTGSSMVRIGGSAVINDLVTGGDGDALSAEMGKVLKGLIDNMGIDGSSIIKDVTYRNGNLVFTFETSEGDKVVNVPLDIDLSGYVPETRKVNGKALSQDITIGQSDISGLAAALAALVPQTRTINGKALSSNVTIGMSDIQGLVDAINNAGSGAVSVTTNQDGTFTIHVGETDYTINLNHTHENMAKLIVCEESDLPSTLDNSTIYVITDSGETEIEKLIIRGLEFAGGGVPDTGEPMISSPSNGSTINLGTNEGSGVSKTITVKGKNLTGDLTVAVGTGLTISYGQSTGQSSVTIPMAQALLGAQVTVSYGGSGALDDGSLVISHGGSVLSSVVVVVVVPQPIGVKLTGAQWLQTDYYPNPLTEIEMEVTFTANANTNVSSSSNNRVVIGCAPNSSPAKYFAIYNTNSQIGLEMLNEDDVTGQNLSLPNVIGTEHSVIRYKSGNVFSFDPAGAGGSGVVSANVQTKQSTMANPLKIGTNSTGVIYSKYDLTIYRLTIKENNVAVRNYIPQKVNGVPGLYDTKNNAFISSKTATELVEVY